MENANSSGVRVAVWVGGTLVVAGVLVLTCYGIYYFSRDFFGSSEVPLGIKVALPVIVAGIVVLLGAVLTERLRLRKREGLEEVEY